MRRPAVVAVLALLWLLATGPASAAHALLRSSDPADGASLARTPRQVTLTFTERPEQRLTTVRVLDSSGRPVQAGPAELVAGRPDAVRATLPALPDGTYTVTWRVVSADDGHVTAGVVAFGVGVGATAAGSATTAADTTVPAPTPLAVAGRWGVYLGLALVLGAATTGWFVLGGRLPAGGRHLLLGAAVLAMAGITARILAERAAVGASLGDLFASGTGRSLGRLAAGVAVTAAAATLLDARPDQDPDGSTPREGWPGRWRFLAAGAAAAVTMLLQVLAGHAAGPSSLRPLNLLAQWLHLLAVGAWVGGLAWLLASLRGQGRPDRTQAVVRFSKLALPVVAVIAVTGAARALELVGGWRALLDTSFGRVLDVKILLFAGLLVLAAGNRYRIVPALAAGAGRLRAIRLGVAAEVGLAAAALLAAAVLTQLPPGKYARAGPAAKPAPPPSVEVQGSDVTTSVRLALTVAPGTAGPNTFTAKVTDYDSGAAVPARRVALRFSLPDRPEVGGSTLELSRGGDGLWRARGSQLSIDGRWVIAALVEAPRAAVTVPLELRTRTAEPRVEVTRAPGQPDVYTTTLPGGGTVQTYVDPGRSGPNVVHFTFFDPGGDEQPIDGAHARMTAPSGASRPIELLRFSAGHFAANVDLQPGRAAFAIEATTDRGVPVKAGFTQQIKE